MKTVHIFYTTPGKTIKFTDIFNKMAFEIKRIFTFAYIFDHIKGILKFKISNENLIGNYF